MALSYVDYNGDGVTTNFVVPFLYLSKAHIHVYIGGTSNVPGPETLAFTWVNNSTIQITTPPPAGSNNVEIRRLTPSDLSQVTFSDGSVEFGADLNTSFLQNFYLAQEYREQTTGLLPSAHSIYSHSDTELSGSAVKGTLLAFDSVNKATGLLVGTDGQILESDSTQTQGLGWKSIPTRLQAWLLSATGLGPALLSYLTTKGDLLVTTGSVVQRKAAGSDGKSLVSDSTQVDGLKWSNPLCLNGATGLSVVPFNIVQGLWANGTTTFTAVGSGGYSLFDGILNDGFIVSDPSQFSAIDLNLTTAGAPTTVAYEYWNGSAWTAFTPALLGGAAWNIVGYLQVQWSAGSLTGWVTGGTGTNVPAGNYNIRVRQTAGTATVVGRAWATHKVSITTLEVIAANVSGGKVLGQSMPVLTPSLTVAGANGLSTGSVAASTAYYGYAIFNPTTVTWAGLFDTSYPVPGTLPAGYTYYTPLTAFRTDANKNIIPYSQQRHMCTLRWSVLESLTTAYDGKTALALAGIPDNAVVWYGSHANNTSATVNGYSDMPMFLGADAGGWTNTIAQAQVDITTGASLYEISIRLLLTTARTIYPYASASAGLHIRTRGYELPGMLC